MTHRGNIMSTTRKRKAPSTGKRRGPAKHGMINADGTAYDGRTAPVFTAMGAVWLIIIIALAAYFNG